MNVFYALHLPFLFIIDFKKTTGYFILESQFKNSGVLFDFNSMKLKSNAQCIVHSKKLDLDRYKVAFEACIRHLNNGDTYLINLTFPTEIMVNLNLDEIFKLSSAKYKLYIPDHFVLFSPERFINIKGDQISTNPMKGTSHVEDDVDGGFLLNDIKENAEHSTIVDLLRNDLSIIAHDVKVEKFKYLETVESNKGLLWQMSSKISGSIRTKYKDKLGDLFDAITPAGSVSGAPKKRTCEIIEDVENYERGFYTGVCGYFDGLNVDSAVMIRYIEKQGDKLFYKSGGGITAKSVLEDEYNELNQKIYVPIF
jgi:para-aminobenzoate synthetase component 1